MHYGPSTSATWPFFLGLSVMLPFWGLAFLASAKVPQVLYFVTLAGILLLYVWILKRRHWLDLPSLLFFAIGWYVHNALQAALVVSIPGHNPGRALVAAALQVLILVLLVRQILRSRSAGAE